MEQEEKMETISIIDKEAVLDRIVDVFEGKSQTYIANEANIRLQTLNHIFAGRNKVSIDIIAKIHRVRPEISLNWLIFGEGRKYIDSDISYSTAEPATVDCSPHKEIDEKTRSTIELCAAKLSMVSESNNYVISQMQTMKAQNDKIVETCNTLLKAIR